MYLAITANRHVAYSAGVVFGRRVLNLVFGYYFGFTKGRGLKGVTPTPLVASFDSSQSAA